MSEHENREFTRLPFEAPLTIQIHDKASWSEGLCSNMSAGGVLVTTKTPIAVDTPVKLALKDEPEKFSAEGTVIRLVEDGEDYLIAIKYDDVA